MKYSHNWLQEYVIEKLPDHKVVESVLNAKAFEVEGIEELGGVDYIYDIKVLPNRAHDALGHAYMAREIAACLDLTFKKEEIEKYESIKNIINVSDQKDSDTKQQEGDSQKLKKEVNSKDGENKNNIKIPEDKSCTRFMSVRIDGVTVDSSPEWLKNKLESIGQRSINNIVDITNYVQYSLNKPMHAYDADNLVGSLQARYAKEGEVLMTLDDKELILNASGLEKVLVISDNEKALGLAGIKGGKYSGVNVDTKSIVIESANFEPVLIRKTSQKYNIKTDASKRFENGISDTLVESGLAMTVSEILKLFPNAKVDKVIDTKVRDYKNYKTGVTLHDVNSCLGANISELEMENILNRLNFKYEKVNTIDKLKELIKICEGKPYKRGASVLYDSPEYFDCSSLISYLYKESYGGMPRISIDQYVFSKEIKKEEARFGDLVFTNTGIIKTKDSDIFSQVLGININDKGIRTQSVEFMRGAKVSSGIDHVGFYLGEDEVLHAASSNGKVMTEKLSDSKSFENTISYRRPFENINSESYIVSVPHERLDVRTKEDMIEEIGRIYGYENLVPVLPKIKKKNQDLDNKVGRLNTILNNQNIVRNILNKYNFSEVITYSLTSKGDIKLVKSASDKSKLRNNISDGLLEAVNKNINNMPLLNIDVIKMYEFGSVFSLINMDDTDNKSDVKISQAKIKESINLAIGVDDGKKKSNYADQLDMILSEIKRELNLSELHIEKKSQKPYIVEINFSDIVENIELKNIKTGKAKDQEADKHIKKENIFLNINSEEKSRIENTKYKSFSQMPFVVRDITFWCEVDTDKIEILKLIKSNAGVLCVSVNIFDEFTKEIEIKIKPESENENMEDIKLEKKIMKSLGYRLVYQDSSRTLTDLEVNRYSDAVYKILKDKGFEIR